MERIEATNLLDTEANDDAPQSGCNELLFFDFECRRWKSRIFQPNQEWKSRIFQSNLCVVKNEAGVELVFKGENTRNEFCEWLFTKGTCKLYRNGSQLSRLGRVFHSPILTPEWCFSRK
ncbi:Hypothetical predicted protein [Paramuricea clavata]|uniref:Uncharacterized protein n=1 Tax=Paramuricea clavata TaxID=317549 RepID=A0A6S7GZ70_PARCT|nr:Hypothetical predicted protein [Paramuricea clavata]